MLTLWVDRLWEQMFGCSTWASCGCLIVVPKIGKGNSAEDYAYASKRSRTVMARGTKFSRERRRRCLKVQSEDLFCSRKNGSKSFDWRMEGLDLS